MEKYFIRYNNNEYIGYLPEYLSYILKNFENGNKRYNCFYNIINNIINLIWKKILLIKKILYIYLNIL